MKERLKKLRERLVNKARIYRFRAEDFVDRLFGRIKVRDAFAQLAEFEKCPPQDEFSVILNLDDEAMMYMTATETAEYRGRLLRLKERCHHSSLLDNDRLRCYETDEDLAEQRERFRNYPF